MNCLKLIDGIKCTASCKLFPEIRDVHRIVQQPGSSTVQRMGPLSEINNSMIQQ